MGRSESMGQWGGGALLGILRAAVTPIYILMRRPHH